MLVPGEYFGLSRNSGLRQMKPWPTMPMVSMAIVCITVSLGNADITRADDETEEFLGRGFAIELPAGVVATTHKDAEDFQIYAFEADGWPLATIYSGWAPQFPRYSKSSNNIVESKLHGHAIRCVEWSDRENLFSRECLLSRGKPDRSLPQFLHIMYLNLNASRRLIVDQLIEATRFEQPTGK